jgi:tetratricopeptide (TPR) repeat protein
VKSTALSPEAGKQVTLLLLVCIALLGIVLYFGIFNAPFIYDDKSSITENERTKDFSFAIRNISDRRYIGSLSFALNYRFGGLRTYGYHLVNIIIHIANTFLIYAIVILLPRPPGRGAMRSSTVFIAFASAFIFLAHPVQTQAVSYISQRYTSLATFFYLLSFAFFFRARTIQEAPFSSARDASMISGACLALSFISALCALKTKETAATLPFMVIAAEFFFFGAGNKKRATLIFLAAMLALPILVYVVPAFFSGNAAPVEVTAHIDAISKETGKITRAEYMVTQIRVIVTYLRLLFFPVNQTLDYDYPMYRSLLSADVLASAALLLLLIIGIVFLFRKHRVASFGVLWFFIALSVESSIIPIRDVIYEHRLYLPSAGLFMAGAATVDRVLKSEKAKIGLAVVLVLLLSLATASRNVVWSDPERLWSDVARKAPANERAHNNLGVVYKERKEYDKAEEQFIEAVEIDKNYMPPYYNLGDIEYRRENYEQALNYLEQALEMSSDPQFRLEILNKLGRTYGAMGQFDKAIETFSKGLELFPSSFVLMNNLGVQYIKADKPDLAIELYERALQKRPDYSMYLNLSVAYSRKGDEQKSMQIRQKAEQLSGRSR